MNIYIYRDSDTDTCTYKKKGQSTYQNWNWTKKIGTGGKEKKAIGEEKSDPTENAKTEERRRRKMNENKYTHDFEC